MAWVIVSCVVRCIYTSDHRTGVDGHSLWGIQLSVCSKDITIVSSSTITRDGGDNTIIYLANNIIASICDIYSTYDGCIAHRGGQRNEVYDYMHSIVPVWVSNTTAVG